MNNQNNQIPCYKIVVSYDGTDYEGWQAQTRTKNTIVGCLQASFYKVFATQISIFGASRTDQGVHALGQVARFYTNIPVPVEVLKREWNIHLPTSILIRSIEKIGTPFNPCADVQQKIYYYHLFLRQPLPFLARYGWTPHFIGHVDLHKFEQALKLFIGTHNFRSFCKVDPERQHEIAKGLTIKTIDNIKLESITKFGLLRIVIYGKSFLHYQIRRMIGYALDVARRKDLPLTYLQKLLDTPHAEQTLLKAPAHGLMLRKIIYKKKGRK